MQLCFDITTMKSSYNINDTGSTDKEAQHPSKIKTWANQSVKAQHTFFFGHRLA